jgi:DNA-binding transcriptional MerR regulator
MPAALSIGDFSRATHLSVKTLRHYHRVGLLAPADIDADTGYRRYTTDQIPTAQVIRRFRDLDMPLDQIHAVLQTPDLRTRNQLISAHLASLEQNLARTQSAVASLRDPARRPVRCRAGQPPPGRRDHGSGRHCRRHDERPAGLVPGRAR